MTYTTVMVRIMAAAALFGTPIMATAAEGGDTVRAERPRIGLVLGGGGARGAAHIGVLRELERMHIPIDAIAGISMGAVVGGLYASGLSVDDLENIVRSIDWQDAFRDDPKRENLRFRRKQDDDEFPIGLELGLRDGNLQLPKGAIQGQKLGLILRSLTVHVPTPADFDALPIPFRAVASDLATGEAYAMAAGDLALAIRASMSAPGIFSPVAVDGRTLVDGGLGGNVPVDTIRAMGVDVIIAVDVEFPLYKPEQLNSALDITGQMLTILVRNQTRMQLATLGPDDVLIRPALGQFGSTEFENIVAAIGPGEAAAAALDAELATLALDGAAWRAHVASRESRRPEEPDRIDFVRIADDGRLAAEILESRLQSRAGDTLDTRRLEQDAGALYGLQTYEQVGYRLVREGAQTGVEFEGRNKSWGPNFLLFGLALEDDFDGTTAFNVSARLTRTAINTLGAEWRNDLQIGTDPHLRSEFYQPLRFDSRYFVALRLDAEQTNFKAFDEDAGIARYRVTNGEFGLDTGRELGRWGEIRAGVFRGRGSASVREGDPGLPRIEADSGGVFGRLAIDTLDDAQIPLRGARASILWRESAPALGADDDFAAIESDLSLVRTTGRHSFEAGVLFNTSLANDELIQNFFPLGGFLRLSGLARGEISGPHAGLVRVTYYRRSGQTGGGLFDIPLYLGASLEAGNAWASRSDIDIASLIVNGSLFAGLDTYLGPLFIAAGFAEGGRSNFYLSLGGPR